MPGLKHKPACNEVEMHIYNNQCKLMEFCKCHDIAIIGYGVLGSSRAENWIEDQNSPKVLEDPVLTTIAKKLKRSPAQVAMRFVVQKGAVCLAKSFNHERIRENFQIFDFELSDKDMKLLDGVNKNMRYLNLEAWKDHPKYPYHDEY